MDASEEHKLLSRVAVLEAKTVFLKNMKSELCTKMSLLKEQTDLKIAALKEATILAEKLNETKHNQMNEVREQLKEQSDTFFTSAEHEAYQKNIQIQIDRINQDIRYTREVLAKMDGKADQKAVVNAQLIAFTGIILGVIGIVTGLFGH